MAKVRGVPFTLLAHQLPVVPLKWRWPRVFSAAGLCVGSVVPDLEHLLHWRHPAGFHTGLGVFWACLPIGLGLLGLSDGLVGPALAKVWPRGWARTFGVLGKALPRAGAGMGAWGRVAASIVVGAWTHLLLDDVTHAEGWTVRHLAPLRAEVLNWAGQKLLVYRALQYGISLAFALGMIGYLIRWWRRTEPAPVRVGRGRAVASLVVGAVVVALARWRLTPVVAHPGHYAEWPLVHVWGIVAFELAAFTFAGLVLAGCAVRLTEGNRA